MITILIVFFSFLLWNIFNETLFLKYNGVKSKIFQRDWHLYDATLRVVLFTTIIIDKFEITILSGKILLCLFLLYHILFDLGFNIKRIKDWKAKFTFIAIFHVGGGKIDSIIKSIGTRIAKLIRKEYNQDFVTKVITITGVVIKLIELIVIIWILLNL